MFGVRATSAADYPSTVLADHPIAYYRLEETSGTTINDSSASGSFGADIGSLTVNYPTLGQPGIDTNSILFDTTDQSFIYAGWYDEFNEQAPFSFEIWARPTSTDPSNYRCPVGNFSGWGVANPSGWYVYQTPGTPATSTFAFIMAANGVWITYTGVTPTTWYHLVGTYDGTNASFYVNGQLVGTQNAAGYVANIVENQFVNHLGIGERGDTSQFFDGNLDEFAYYTNALSLPQVQAHYDVGTNSFRAAEVGPSILQDVAPTSAYAGHTVEFSVIADGPGTLMYQWYKGVSQMSGETNHILDFTCSAADDNTTYYVHVSNAFGSTNSSTATLTVKTNILIDAPLTPIARNVGSAAAFEIAAEGALPLSYAWYRNGSATPIPGATGSTLWLSNVQLTNDNDTYSVTISNPWASTNSDPATLNVHARAVNVPTNRYAAVVMADRPVAYWRLDEGTGSTTAVDAAGSFDGTYTPGAGSFTFGVPTGIPAETNKAVDLAGGATVVIPYSIEINPPSGPFTVEGWFKAASATTGGNDYRTVISSMSNPYGIGPTGWLVYQTAANVWSWWPYNGYYNGVQLNDTATIVPNAWYYLVLTYDGTTFTLYVNGVAKASGQDAGFAQNGNVPSGGAADYNYNYNTTPGLPTGSGAMTIGQRVDNAFGPFLGSVDDVAVYNKALTPLQIQDHFLNTTHLTITSSGNNVIIVWPTGTLQSATAVNGPYTDVGGAASPYTNSVSGTQIFYRVQLQ